MTTEQQSWWFAHRPKAIEARVARSIDLANKLQRELAELENVDVPMTVTGRALDYNGVDGRIEVRDTSNRLVICGAFYQMKEPRMPVGAERAKRVEGYAFEGFHPDRHRVSDPEEVIDGPVTPNLFLLVSPTRRSNKLPVDDVGICLVDDIHQKRIEVAGLVELTGYVRAERCASLRAVLDAVIADATPRTWQHVVDEVLRRQRLWKVQV